MFNIDVLFLVCDIKIMYLKIIIEFFSFKNKNPHIFKVRERLKRMTSIPKSKILVITF